MAITPPAWCSGAIPIQSKGWVDPDSNELLISSRFSAAQVESFWAEKNGTGLGDMSKDELESLGREHGVELDKRMKHEDLIEQLKTAINDLGGLDSMTKKQLETLGREHGIELDRRYTKAKLITTMREILSK
jgi:hypothetical protein